MLSNIDLHTLRVLEEIFTTGSLSRTADRLELSQPAVSMTLAKLRRHFDDKLFVRVGNEMKPTLQAEGMRDAVTTAISAIETTLNYRNVFVPSTTQRNFRISVSDIGQLVMVPELLFTFNELAPNATLEFSSINERTAQALQSGAIDLVAGFAPQMPDGFLQRKLYEETFVILARKDHPRINQMLSLDEFKEECHVAVLASSSTHLVIDRALERQHLRRIVKIKVPNFMIVAKIVSETDYLSILPRRAGKVLAADNNLQVLDPPFELAGYQARQYWHERQSCDSGNQWLRELFVQLFAGS